MAGEDLIELKFKLADGIDIGPSKYSPSTTVGSLKEKILAQWPKDKENVPKSINDMKLVNAGKLLENKTLAESRLPIGELPGGIITMHIVVRPPFSDKNSVFMLHPVNPKDDKIDNASSFGLSMSLSMHRMITERFVSDASLDFEYSWIQAAAEETRILEVICRFDVLISHSKMFCGSSIVEKSEELGG
ncbi:Membrane-anchored ubiquitin-fold protein 6 [Camellia lanceoleosa]|nr:Membrane-anchored ubiquitin-fold protein 6 [Camellia lanceoleosa]